MTVHLDPVWLQACASLEDVDAYRAKRIIREVAKARRLKVSAMLSQRRSRPLVLARQEAMWRLREETSLSLPAIGRMLGNRDHTTVLHGCRAHEKRLIQSGADPSRRDAREASASPQAVPAPSYPGEAI